MVPGVIGEDSERDLFTLVVARVGRLEERGSPWGPYRLVDPSGAEVRPVARRRGTEHRTARQARLRPALVCVLVDPFSSGAVHGGQNQLGGSPKPPGCYAHRGKPSRSVTLSVTPRPTRRTCNRRSVADSTIGMATCAAPEWSFCSWGVLAGQRDGPFLSPSIAGGRDVRHRRDPAPVEGSGVPGRVLRRRGRHARAGEELRGQSRRDVLADAYNAWWTSTSWRERGPAPVEAP